MGKMWCFKDICTGRPSLLFGEYMGAMIPSEVPIIRCTYPPSTYCYTPRSALKHQAVQELGVMVQGTWGLFAPRSIK